MKIWFELFFYNTVGFSSAKNKKKKERTEKRKKRDTFLKNTIF